MRILIVEDEEKLARSLKKGFEKKGYVADYLLEGEKAEARISLYRKEYDVVILDLMLPNKSGLEICRSVREQGVLLPILILTARNSIEDKVTLFNSGADDYVIKPFSFSELSARVNALLRRPEEIESPALLLRDIRLDLNTHKVWKGDAELELTLKEFNLLEYFMRHPNQILSREQILDTLWGFEYSAPSNIVDVHVKNLRKKLDYGTHDKVLETIRGMGYRLKT